jgi:hypothetical protein
MGPAQLTTFAVMRLHLLEPNRHPALLKAMYGLLMILPQSHAFHTLRKRLKSASDYSSCCSSVELSTAAKVDFPGIDFVVCYRDASAHELVGSRVQRPGAWRVLRPGADSKRARGTCRSRVIAGAMASVQSR